MCRTVGHSAPTVRALGRDAFGFFLDRFLMAQLSNTSGRLADSAIRVNSLEFLAGSIGRLTISSMIEDHVVDSGSISASFSMGLYDSASKVGPTPTQFPMGLHNQSSLPVYPYVNWSLPLCH